MHEAREAGHLQLHKIDSKLNGADRLRLTRASASPDGFADAVASCGVNPKRRRVSQMVSKATMTSELLLSRHEQKTRRRGLGRACFNSLESLPS